MLYDYLAEFYTVAKTQSLTKASEHLALSSSALSRHMHALEQGLNLVLFERNPPGVKGIELTEEGRHVFQSASDMIEIMDGVRFYAKTRHSADNVSLTIYGTSENPVRIRNLKRAVSETAQAEGVPEPELVFVSKDAFGSKAPGKAVEDGDIDLFITYPSNEPELSTLAPSCEIVPLFDFSFVAVMEPTHPLAGKPELTAGDLDGVILRHPAASYRQAHPFWLETKRVFREEGVNFRSATMQFQGPSNWFRDFDDTVLILSATYREIESLRIYGKTVIPLTGLHGTAVGVLRSDNEYARFVAECAQEIDIP